MARWTKDEDYQPPEEMEICVGDLVDLVSSLSSSVEDVFSSFAASLLLPLCCFSALHCCYTPAHIFLSPEI